MYESIYKYITKTLQQGKFTLESKTLSFGGLKTFEVGRPTTASKRPYFKYGVLVAVVLYLLIGILI